MNKRVVLVDGHVLMREMLGSLLRREPDFEVISEAATGLEAWNQCRRGTPSFVILHLALSELTGAELVRRIRHELPDTQVLVYSSSTDRRHLSQGLAARPHGMILGNDSLETLKEAIRVVSGGGSYFTPHVCRMMHDPNSRAPEEHLTPREREVLQLVAESCSSKEIAARLQVAIKTVENHRQRLMEKLQLRDVAALTRYAIRHGLIDLTS
jgi:DNA-binding NarL/FixJ family response regulator